MKLFIFISLLISWFVSLPPAHATSPVEQPCIDSDGDGWGWNGVDTCKFSKYRLRGATETLIHGREFPVATSGRLQWAKRDVAGKTLQCNIQNYIPEAGTATGYVGAIVSVEFGQDYSTSVNWEYGQTTGDWSIDTDHKLITPAPFDFNLTAFEQPGGYLFVHQNSKGENGETWVDGYVTCIDLDQTQIFRATGTPCADADGDGWGWNGFESCKAEIDPTADCEYGSAHYNDGWGYNNTTGQSCPPDPSRSVFVPEDKCEYPGSIRPPRNGWGWNRATQESCAPLQ